MVRTLTSISFLIACQTAVFAQGPPTRCGCPAAKQPASFANPARSCSEPAPTSTIAMLRAAHSASGTNRPNRDGWLPPTRVSASSATGASVDTAIRLTARRARSMRSAGRDRDKQFTACR